MNKAIGYGIAAIIGAAIGVAGTSKYFHDKYEKAYQEDIKSVRELHAGKAEKAAPAKVEPEVKPAQVHEALIEQLKQYTTDEPDVIRKNIDSKPKPYVIGPDDYGEIAEYDQVTLYYYRDKVVATEEDRKMSDEEIDCTIGKESLKHFGEYEEDRIYVRNDFRKEDYEVLMSQLNYPGAGVETDE